MSYLRETVEEVGYEVIKQELEPKWGERDSFYKLYIYDPETKTYELWYESPNFAGYAIVYQGREFEFVSSWTPT